MIRKSAVSLWAALGSVLILIIVGLVPSPSAAGQSVIPTALRDRANREGHVRVIVELNPRSGAHVPEGRLSGPATAAQRREIRASAARVISKLRSGARDVVYSFDTVPYLVLDVDGSDLEALENSSADIVDVMDDPILRPSLAESVPLIEGDQVWAAGYDGTGTTVAVLDTGVDSTHPFLSGKVIEEACYSSNVTGLSQSVCPNGLPTQIGPGAAVPCTLPECIHGTHVAGIAAGNGASAGVTFSGVARGAQLMAVQVFSEIINSISCGGAPQCMGAFTSDIIAGLDRVYAAASRLNVVSVNMSLGGRTYVAFCDSDPTKPAIDNLRSIGVATVIASGNSSSTAGVSAPACISSAVSVGSTNKSNQVSSFSNVASFLSILAPGESITSSIPGGSFRALSGTSMATPHISGSWSLLRQAVPVATVGTILNALRQTGLPITDARSGGTATIPRARLFAALSALAPTVNPQPAVTTMSPTVGRAGMLALTLTITGSGFDGFSVVRWNGDARVTTVVNASTIQASILPADLAAAGTADVTVFNPTPGGGISSALTFTINPAATLAVSATTVAPGTSVTTTLANGYGGSQDWIALAASSAPNTSVLSWTYIGANVTSRTWTTALPFADGTYQFRLFLNNGFTRAATSPPVVVDPALAPPPVVTSLVPSRMSVGSADFTLNVVGTAFVPSSTVLWNGQSRTTAFVSSTEIRAVIGAADVAALGTAQVSVRTPSPGGGTSGALTFTIDPLSTLTPSATSVPAGAAVSVTLTGGIGGTYDWLALAAVGSPDQAASIVRWTYVGGGVLNCTWNTTAPAVTGQYEFRLYLNNVYTRAATSAPIAVTAAVPPTLIVDKTNVSGGESVTATLTNGYGGASDWLALAAVGSPNTSYIQWIYVGGGVSTRTWTVSMPATGGLYEFRLFPNGGFTVAATSPPVTVTAPTPVLAVSTTTALVSSSVSVTLTGGVGGPSDWLALAAVGSANTSFVQWTYVGNHVTTRTWTVTMPSTPGAYEFRLFLNGGYLRAATSPTVTTILP